MPIATPLVTVQQLYGAFGAGDLPAFVALLAPDVRWRFIGAPGLPYTGEVKGPEAVQKWLDAVMQTDEIQAFEPREFFAGERHVTVIGWEKTVARSTGRPFEADWLHVFEVDGGRVQRFLGMYDTAAAAEAFG